MRTFERIYLHKKISESKSQQMRVILTSQPSPSCKCRLRRSEPADVPPKRRKVEGGCGDGDFDDMSMVVSENE